MTQPLRLASITESGKESKEEEDEEFKRGDGDAIEEEDDGEEEEDDQRTREPHPLETREFTLLETLRRQLQRLKQKVKGDKQARGSYNHVGAQVPHHVEVARNRAIAATAVALCVVVFVILLSLLLYRSRHAE